MSRIPKVFLKRIQDAKDGRITSLDLSGVPRRFKEGEPAQWTRLPRVPAEVFELTHLKQLSLRMNNLTSLPESVSKLQNLTSLDLSHNHLTALPDSISQLSKLRILDLGANSLASLPDSLSQLRNITYINLYVNRLAAFPDLILSFKKLKNLNLGGLSLGSIPDSLERLTKLEWLYLWGNGLTAVPNCVYSLLNLRELYLNRNRLTNIPERITSLQNLRVLHLWNNCLKSIPDSIYKLSALETLTLDNETDADNEGLARNSIEAIPQRILELKKLKFLSVKNNPIKNIPPEIIAEGIDAIRKYFRQLEEEGEDYLHEAKLLVLGEGGAGKTTLANKIVNPDYELCEENSTQGIEVSSFSFPIENGNVFRVNTWDFGGQEIYHATHQFFLTKRSLYVLVADTRKEDTDFYYWLNVVELLSNNSPLLIVKNEKQNRHREINERQLRGQFSNLKETLVTNLATNRGLAEVIDYIKHYITKLPHVGTPLPKTWTRVRASLEQDTRDYLSLTEYQAICEKNGFTDLKDKLQLSGYLHDLGVILHFQADPILKNSVILNPKWGTSAAYKVLDNRTVIGNYGKFSRGDLADIWAEPEYAYMHDELLQLMINFKLCYQLPDTDLYIAPQLLSENQPAYAWDEKNNLILRYTYEFMPKGIITQFIVAVHHLINEQMHVWKSGVVLEREQTQAEVIEYYGKREIRVRVSGKNMKELITIVTYELDRINASYKRLKASKLIPCNCARCRDNQEPHFYHFDTLRRFINDGQDKIQCQFSYYMVDVRALLDDVVQLRLETEEGQSLIPSRTRDRVFISYSHLNKDWLNKFQTALRPLIRNRNINIWDDTQISPGSKWKDEIEEALRAAKVALLLVTQEFLASDFIAENELPPLLSAAEKEGLTILWVAVSHSMYKETSISDYQAANNPARPLDELTPTQLNRALVDIGEKIKSAMSK